ncbi:tetratricopeptide repeat protein [Embleya sp. NPDC005575]|uniref:tetratricopeptide repeat protein n=1 Tax=Embleya sp. NPDC005575 TaxID=3156892 RepID=UPI0033A12126
MPRILALTLSRLCDRPLTLGDLGFPEPALPSEPQSPAAPRPVTAPARESGDPTNRRQALALLGGVTTAPLLLPGKAAADTATLYTTAATTSDLQPADLNEIDLAVHDLSATFSARTPDQLWPIAAAYRHQVHQLLRRPHTLREGRELTHHAGMLSVVLAWIAHDYGDTATAFAADAWAHGEQADDPEVCAWAEDVRCTNALYADRPYDALTAATRGLAVAPRSGTAIVRLSTQIARAHAKVGQRDAFETAAAGARTYMDRIPTHGAGLFGVDAVRILSYEASAHGWLGKPLEAGRAAEEAIREYEAVTGLRQAPTRLAIAQLDLALSRVALGQPDSAVELGRRALSGDRVVDSIRSRARDLDRALRRNYPTVSDVREFSGQVHALRG